MERKLKEYEMWLYRSRLSSTWTVCVNKEKNIKVKGNQRASAETFGTCDKKASELYTHGHITQNK